MGGVEPPFAAPVTDTRFVVGFGYMRRDRANWSRQRVPTPLRVVEGHVS